MESLPRLSIVICTRNRIELLQRACESLAKQVQVEDSIEVIVIDNASSDGTSQWLADVGAGTGREAPGLLGSRYRIRGEREPVSGLSRARNRGVRLARGEFVAFLDDDAWAEPEWADSLLRAFDEGGSDTACVGGPVLPDWGRPEPRWIQGSEDLRGMLSILTDEREAGPLPIDRHLIGANIAFRKSALLRLGGFSEDLGRQGACLKSNEELELIRRLSSFGQQVRWDPRIRVHHRIHAERLSRLWFIRRSFWQGRSDVRMKWASGQTPDASRSLRRFLFFPVEFHYLPVFEGFLRGIMCLGEAWEALRCRSTSI